MRNALTVDVEDWYQTSDFDFPVAEWERFEDRVERNTHRVLDLFDEWQVKGTFFVLGCVAKKFPSLVREISLRGHEIGSHGGWHRLLTRMSAAEIEEDIRFSKGILEDQSGRAVKCFRAPSWSLSPETYYVLEILQEQGFTIDSSLQPFRTPLSGVAQVSSIPFYPRLHGVSLSLLEFPSTVATFAGQPVPFCGGLYLRVWPLSVIKACLQRVNRSGPGMIYVHPWELDTGQPRLSRPWFVRFTHYYNLNTTEDKLRSLFEEFTFAPLSEVAEEHSFPSLALTVPGERVERSACG